MRESGLTWLIIVLFTLLSVGVEQDLKLIGEPKRALKWILFALLWVPLYIWDGFKRIVHFVLFS